MAYEKTNWNAGTIVKPAHVVIDGTEYEVTPEERTGATPINIPALQNIENGIEANETNINNYVNGNTPMGNIVVDGIRSKNLMNIIPSRGTRNSNNVIAQEQAITINSDGYGTETSFYLNDVSNIGQYLATSFSNARDFHITDTGGTYCITYYLSYKPSSGCVLRLWTNKRYIDKNNTHLDENNKTSFEITLDDDEYIKSIQFYAGASLVFDNLVLRCQIEKGNVESDYSKYIDVTQKNSYSRTYDPSGLVTITGKTPVNINDSVLKAENFVCKTGRILATTIGTYKVSGGVGYLALKMVNKDTNEEILPGFIVSSNVTTNLCNSGSRIFNVPVGTYDIYLIGYANNDSASLTINSYCALGFSVAEI